MSAINEFAETGEQKSISWLLARTGLTTCSRLRDVVDKLKSGKPGAKREAYKWEKVVEKLTGQPFQHYENAAMQHGTLNEPIGRMAFESRTGMIVSEVGLIHHPDIGDFAGSPDGLIDEDSGLEIKCPFNSANHLQCFLTGVPEEHVAQIQGLMACTGRMSWWFASFDPRLPAPLDLYIQRVPRDDDYIATLEAEIIVFNAEVAALVAALRERGEK